MSIGQKLHWFNKENVDQAPAAAGVYALYVGDELIYFGRALGGTVTIRSRLQKHLAGAEGACTQSATYFSWEVSANPARRESQLVAWFETTFGRRPRCNERRP